MKLFTSLLIASLALTNVFAYPARESNSDDDAEIIVVPLETQSGFNNPDYDNFQGVIDTGFGNNYYPSPSSGYFPIAQPYYPWNWNFRGFFDTFEDAFRRMREHAANSWTRIPFPQPGTEVRFDDTDDEGNTTSVVKIVDGHKVIINDTIYKKDTGFGTSIIKVRVIDVQPLDDNSTTSTDTTDVNKDIGTRFNTDSDPEDEDKKPEIKKNDDIDDEKDTEKGSPEELDDDSNDVLNTDIDNTAEVKTTPNLGETTTVVTP